MKTKPEIFEGVLNKMLATYKKKNHDYSVNGKSAFEKGFENFGITSLAIRLGDKVDRLTAFAKGTNYRLLTRISKTQSLIQRFTPYLGLLR